MFNRHMMSYSHTINPVPPRTSQSSAIFSRPPLLLAIGQFLTSTELCYYSKISVAIHAIWCYHHSPYSKFFITQVCHERKKMFSGTIKCNVTDCGLKFEWKCTKKEYENLLREYNSDQFIECQPFEEPKTKTKWFIEIFPNGYHLSKNGYGALFLTMEWKPKNIKEVRARLLCNCSQVNLKFSDGVTYDWRKFSKGKHNAFKISDVLANECITLSVELIIIDVTESETRINNEIKDQIDNMHNKMLQLQSRMDEIDSIQNRLFNIEKLLHKMMINEQEQQQQHYYYHHYYHPTNSNSNSNNSSITTNNNNNNNNNTNNRYRSTSPPPPPPSSTSPLPLLCGCDSYSSSSSSSIISTRDKDEMHIVDKDYCACHYNHHHSSHHHQYNLHNHNGVATTPYCHHSLSHSHVHLSSQYHSNCSNSQSQSQSQSHPYLYDYCHSINGKEEQEPDAEIDQD